VIPELACNIFFTVEMLLRMMGLGAVPPRGVLVYFKAPWNVFDALMVACGWLILIPEDRGKVLQNINSLRALRPLRIISRFESIRFVIRGILAALPLLMSVYVLVFIFIIIFGVTGLMAFTGVYHYICIQDGTDNVTEAEAFNLDDPDMAGCSGWRACPTNFTCTVRFHTGKGLRGSYTSCVIIDYILNWKGNRRTV
jgi:hypothetical protein